MQLHINHVDPAEAARTLTFAQINAALREVTQQLYGVVAARNIAISAQLPCDTAIYTTANNVAKHPQTAWDAACRAHVDWIRAHAGELLLLWADYKGVNRLDHDAVADVHGCAKHLRHLAAALDAGTAAIPAGAVTAEAWLATLTPKQRTDWAPRVATTNPPAGCLFGLRNMERTFWVDDDCVGSYLKLHDYNLTRPSILRLNPELKHLAGYGPAPPTAKQRAAIKAEQPKTAPSRKRARDASATDLSASA